jgi:hypothetical protein
VRHPRRWSVSRPTPLVDRPWFVTNRSPEMRADHYQRTKVPPISEVMECARLVLLPSSDDWDGAPIGYTYMSHYGDLHSEDGDHLTSTHGPFEQQR